MDDREAMRLALACAHSVVGRTSPRPPVGAVVVRDDVILARGATAPPYGSHAEVEALLQTGEAARGATLYVTLEPCCIQAHTPPCTTAISAAGIRRVVVGTCDPNPAVYQQGIAQLRAAGIAVTLLQDCPEAIAAQELIRPFATFVASRRSYVTAKWAMTLDGKIASHSGSASWVSGPDARSWVHALRDQVDAILVGAGTARADNPQLTVRLTPEQQFQGYRPRPQPPLAVIASSDGRLPADLALLQPERASRTCVLVGETCSKSQQRWFIERGIDVEAVAADESGRPHIQAMLQALARKGVMHVLLEGGAQLLGSAFDQRCIDHVIAFVAPKLIGGQHAPSPLAGQGRSRMDEALRLRNLSLLHFTSDILVEGDMDYDQEPFASGSYSKRDEEWKR